MTARQVSGGELAREGTGSAGTAASDVPADPRSLLDYLAVAGVVDARELEEHPDRSLLPAILRDGLVTREVVDGRPALRLRSGLAAARCQRLTASETARVRRRIAAVRPRLGVLDCGLAAAHALGDAELCVRIMDRWWLRIAAGPYHRLQHRVVMSLPPAVVRGSVICSLRWEFLGLLPVGTTRLRLSTTPDGVRRVYRAGRELPLIQASAVAVAARRVHQDYPSAAAMAARAEPTVRFGLRQGDTSSRGFACYWYLQAGLSAYLAGDVTAARRHYRTAWEVRAADESGFAGRDVAGKLALLHAVEGETAEAEAWLRAAEAIDVAPDVNEQFRGWVRQSMVLAGHVLRLDRGELEEVAVAELGAQQTGRDEFWAVSAWVQSRWALLQRRPQRVAGIVEDAVRRYAPPATGPGLHRGLLGQVRAEARLALGRGAEARSILATVGDESPYGRVTTVRLRLLTGDADAARLLAVDHRSREDTRPRDLPELALLEAAACRALGDRTAAVAAAQAGADLAGDGGPLHAFAGVDRDVLDDLAADVPALGRWSSVLDEHRIGALFPDRVAVAELSERELVVVHALSAGDSLPRVADSLHVSVNTVKTQLRSVYRKLGVDGRDEAVAAARRLGLLGPEKGAAPRC